VPQPLDGVGGALSNEVCGCRPALGRALEGSFLCHRTRLITSLVLFVTAFAQAGELPTAQPDAVGLSPGKLDRLKPALQKLVDDGKIPGGVAVVARRGKVAYSEFVPLLREVAAGLHEGDGGAHPITFKPDPAPYSSSFIHGESWLDFNSMQTWKQVELIYPFVTKDYNLKPIKPVLMAEGAYEQGSEYGFDVTPLWIRRQAYYSYLAGGHRTYGHNDSWRVRPTWKQALDAPGATQLGILKEIFEGLKEWWNLVPDQDIFTSGGNTSGQILNLAARQQGRTLDHRLSGRQGRVLHQAGQVRSGRTVERVLDQSPRWQAGTDREAIEDGRGHVLDARGMGRRAVGPGGDRRVVDRTETGTSPSAPIRFADGSSRKTRATAHPGREVSAGGSVRTSQESIERPGIVPSDGLRPMGTYLPVPRFPGGDLGDGGGCLAGGFLAVGVGAAGADAGAAAGADAGAAAGAALARSLAASLAIFLAGFFASATASVGAAFAADWFAWAG
jgi:Protein of unknown function (DUF4038)